MQFVEARQCTVWFWETLATCYLCNNVCVEQHQASYFLLLFYIANQHINFIIFSSFTFLKRVPILQRRRIVLLILHHPSFITCIYLLSTQLELGKAVQRYNAGILHLPLFMNIFCLAKSRKLILYERLKETTAVYLVLLHVNIEHILLSYCLGIFFSYISTHIVFIIINFFFFWLNADYIPQPTIMQAGNDKIKFHASTISL